MNLGYKRYLFIIRLIIIRVIIKLIISFIINLVTFILVTFIIMVIIQAFMDGFTFRLVMVLDAYCCFTFLQMVINSSLVVNS